MADDTLWPPDLEDAEKEAARDEKIKNLAQMGIDVLAQPGAMLAALVAQGPVGAIAAGLVVGGASVLVKGGFLEMLSRQITTPQKKRLGVVYVLAVRGIQDRLDAGEQLRTDGFFTHTEQAGAPAEELLETVCLKAMNTPQLKKLPYMAKLYENTAFSSLAPDNAFLIAQYADQLTYRALVCLQCICKASRFRLRTTTVPDNFNDDVYAVLHEILRLGDMDLVYQKIPEGFIPLDYSGQLIAANLWLTAMGTWLLKAMSLTMIPDEDVETMVARHLR
jgi:hypothetical protein